MVEQSTDRKNLIEILARLRGFITEVKKLIDDSGLADMEGFNPMTLVKNGPALFTAATSIGGVFQKHFSPAVQTKLDELYKQYADDIEAFEHLMADEQKAQEKADRMAKLRKV